MSLLWAILGNTLAATIIPSYEEVPFILDGEGVYYLGWLTPQACPTDKHLPCDVVVVDPRSGRLVVEHRETSDAVRRFHKQSWSLGNESTYEMDGDNLLNATDVWGSTISYSYDGGELTEIEWADGRHLTIDYDRKGRVVQMTDSNHELTFNWRKEAHHTLLSNGTPEIDWYLQEQGIQSRTSYGTETTLMLTDGQISGWIDPRGFTTDLDPIKNGWELSHGGLRKWTIEHQDGTLSGITLEGSGSWRWKLDESGQLDELVDPSLRRLEVLRNNPQTERLLRSNGFIDCIYNAQQDLVEIQDVSGRLVYIDRDAFGHVVRVEDAVGESYVIERGVNGLIKRLILRDGQEWNIEYDASGRVRTIVQPDQILWALERNIAGQVTRIAKSFSPTIEITWSGEHWTNLEVSNGQTLAVQRDRAGRIVHVRDSREGEMSLQYDILGQIEQIRLDDQTWNIERNAFGQVIGWNELMLQRGTWGSIRKTEISGLNPWTWNRDGAGRLIELQTGDVLSIEYDGQGLPTTWQRGEQQQVVEYNHWGWKTQMDNLWLKHDSRGLVRKVGLHDLQWQFNRDSAGRILVLKGPHDMQLGLNYGVGNNVTQLRFPSGQLQHFIHHTDKTTFEYTSSNGQRVTVGEEVDEGVDWLLPKLDEIKVEGALSDAVGVQTVPYENDVTVIEYDSMYFVRQVCDLSSCIHLTYDPRGRLQSISDGSGLPVNLIWGWSGWREVPLVLGGTIGLYSMAGLNVQTDGRLHQEYMYWPQSENNEFRQTDIMDSAQFDNGYLQFEGLPLIFEQNRVYFGDSQGQLQNNFPWMQGQIDAVLFEQSSVVSIWNRPIELMIQMGLVTPIQWYSPPKKPSLEWLSSSFDFLTAPWMKGVRSLPIDEPELEMLLLTTLLNGEADPTEEQVFEALLGDSTVTEILSSTFPLKINSSR